MTTTKKIKDLTLEEIDTICCLSDNCLKCPLMFGGNIRTNGNVFCVKFLKKKLTEIEDYEVEIFEPEFAE